MKHVASVFFAFSIAISALGCHSHQPPEFPNRQQPFAVTSNADGTLGLYRMIEEFDDLSSHRVETTQHAIDAFADREAIEIESSIVCYTFHRTHQSSGEVECGVYCSDKSEYVMDCEADIFRDHGYDARYTWF